MSESNERTQAMLVTLAVAVCSATHHVYNLVFEEITEFLTSDEKDLEAFIINLETAVTLALLNSEQEVAKTVTNYNPALALELAKIRSQEPDGNIGEQLTASILNLKFRNS
jgi:hypothetical protein